MLPTCFGFTAEIARLCLVRLAQTSARHEAPVGDYIGMLETYLTVVNQAIRLLCKNNQFSEAALVSERVDELRKNLPQRFSKPQQQQLASMDAVNQPNQLLPVEATHFKRRIKLLALQVLSSYGVFVVKNDQFAVDLEHMSTEADSVMETFQSCLGPQVTTSNLQV